MKKYLTMANFYRLFFWAYLVTWLVDLLSGKSIAQTRADVGIALACLAMALILEHREHR